MGCERKRIYKLVGGWVLITAQWGAGSEDGSGKDTISTVNFPISFSNCFIAGVFTQVVRGYANNVNDFINADVWYQTISWTTTSVRVIRQQTNTKSEVTRPLFLAVGR